MLIYNNVFMKEINPKETSRAYAFEMWLKAPMPMVTFSLNYSCETVPSEKVTQVLDRGSGSTSLFGESQINMSPLCFHERDLKSQCTYR